MTKTLTDNERTRIGLLLVAKQEDLEAGIRGTLREIESVLEARSDGSADDEHDPEGSTLSSDWSRLQGLRNGLTGQLAETMDAIARLDAGTWGTCRRCGRTIAEARLEARPTAPLCIECASAGGD